PGQSRLTTPRNEADSVEILSGVSVDGLTLGTPIGMLVRNQDHRSNDYDTNSVAYRPSHADATYDAKYGLRAIAGGGRSSARETIGRVAAAAVAKKVLSMWSGIEIMGYVKKVQEIEATVDPETVTMAAVEANIARCPDEETAQKMIARIDEIRKTGNSVGGREGGGGGREGGRGARRGMPAVPQPWWRWTPRSDPLKRALLR
ncbi:hypothetical protein VYU27_010522, partial [Nannochloropsis oceanica]